MKTTLVTVAALATLATLSACAYRSPEMYRDDTTKSLQTKNEEIRGCYDGILKGTPNAGGKVTVNFDVETEEGKITNVKADKANTTAPDALVECVTRSITGLVVPPPDKRTGQATYTWDFSAPPAPPAPPAAPVKAMGSPRG